MAIFTKDLSKKYGDQVALDKVSIDLKKGHRDLNLMSQFMKV